MPSSGFQWCMCGSPTTAGCHSLGLCIALYVVTALNSLAIQSEAGISTAKYECSPFSGSRLEIIFTENKLKQARTDVEVTKQ